MLLAVLVFATLAVGAGAQDAATPTAAASDAIVTGPVSLTYAKGASFGGSQVRVTGNVHLESSTFAMQAETVTVDLLPGKHARGAAPIRHATLDAAPGGQVSGHFDDQVQGRNYKFRADHAEYAPDSARAGGGKIDLTGHVVVAVNAPVALDGPLVTQTGHAVVLLGPGPQYPQITTGAGQINFTPLNGGQ